MTGGWTSTDSTHKVTVLGVRRPRYTQFHQEARLRFCKLLPFDSERDVCKVSFRLGGLPSSVISNPMRTKTKRLETPLCIPDARRPSHASLHPILYALDTEFELSAQVHADVPPSAL